MSGLRELTSLGRAPAGTGTTTTEPVEPDAGGPPVVRRVGELGLVAKAASALTTLRQLDPGVSEVDRVNQALIAWESLELWRASGYRFTVEHPYGAVRDVTWCARRHTTPGAAPRTAPAPARPITIPVAVPGGGRGRSWGDSDGSAR